MWSWRMEVTRRDDRCSWSVCLERMFNPSPPCLAGTANKCWNNKFGSQGVIEWFQEVADIWDGATQVGPLPIVVRLHTLDSQELTFDST